MRANILAFLVFLGMTAASVAHAECYGEGEYMVCSDVETDDDGDVHAKSWDTDGNTYQMDTETRPYLNGHETQSSDSDGNSYSIRSWTDSSGAHSEDSEGNICTITPSGQMIGCGE
jgi:hypothetical protein